MRDRPAMAAISSLVDYGSDSSEDDTETKQVSEDMNLHLKPVKKKDVKISSAAGMELVAAPQVAPKVSHIFGKF